MQGKHTPGPWIVGTEPSFNTIRIRDSDLDALPVATIFYSIGGKPRYQRAEAEANAALIAAAPELYEALHELVEDFRKYAKGCSDGYTAKADAALAKAQARTGGERGEG